MEIRICNWRVRVMLYAVLLYKPGNVSGVHDKCIMAEQGQQFSGSTGAQAAEAYIGGCSD